MESLPLPSHVHYELLLQLLERQTLLAASQHPDLHGQVNQLIITLRKAVAQQKQIEDSCDRQRLRVDYRWPLNQMQSSETPV
jgi:hypothetical protein